MFQRLFVRFALSFGKLPGPLVQLAGHLERLLRGTTEGDERLGKFGEINFLHFDRTGRLA